MFYVNVIFVSFSFSPSIEYMVNTIEQMCEYFCRDFHFLFKWHVGDCILNGSL